MDCCEGPSGGPFGVPKNTVVFVFERKGNINLKISGLQLECVSRLVRMATTSSYCSMDAETWPGAQKEDPYISHPHF